MATITVDEEFFYDLLMQMSHQRFVYFIDASGMIDTKRLYEADNEMSACAQEQQRAIAQIREKGFDLWRQNKEEKFGLDWWKLDHPELHKYQLKDKDNVQTQS